MLEKLYYRIAGHCLIIKTSNAEATEELLPSFRPFRLEQEEYKRDWQKKDKNLLFCFSGDAVISLPSEEPDETLVVDGATFAVYHNNGEITVSMTLGGTEQQTGALEHRIQISANKKEVVSDLTLTASYEEYFLPYLLRIAFGMTAAYHRTLKIHASVIKKDGRAVVFLGTSGTGKSTHSSLWLKHVPGSSLLNDDEPLVRLPDDGRVWVFGAPWSGSTPCYRNKKAEVAAFVLLQQGPENKLTKMGALEAFKVLLQSAAVFRSGREHREHMVTLIYDILEKVPVYRMVNRPNRGAVQLTHSLLHASHEDADNR
ncbi:MAG: hypothetical protein GX877_06265 [Bacteroidales bacterium]|nr:hypothetical protein [Bacteroidales bacterium]